MSGLYKVIYCRQICLNKQVIFVVLVLHRHFNYKLNKSEKSPGFVRPGSGVVQSAGQDLVEPSQRPEKVDPGQESSVARSEYQDCSVSEPEGLCNRLQVLLFLLLLI